MLRISALLPFALATLAVAQPNPKVIDFNEHLWTSYSGDHQVAGPWGIHFDAQWRRASLGRTWQQYLLRPAINYSLTPRVSLTAGYTFAKTYPYGEFPLRTSIVEHRMYEQAAVTHPWRTLRVQHRMRLEQRFVKYPDPQPRSWTYQNRVRYQIRVEAPLVTDSTGRASWYVPAFNEVFIGIAPNYGARPFDQNRLFIGIGKALPAARVEAGYMNHLFAQRNGRVFEFNNTLFVTVTSNVPLARLWGG